MILENKVAIVTGASRGIGRAVAVDLVRNGCDVVLAGRDAAALEETTSECKAQRDGAKTLVVTGDVADQRAVESFVTQAVETFGRVDIAVANAGQSVDSLLLRLKPDVLDQMLSVNLKSAFYLCGAVAKPMMKQRSGSIVLMSSIAGLMGNVGQAAYAASKAGLLGLAKSLAKELGSRNIRVNAVAPGIIETAMTEKMTGEMRDFLLKQTALGRTGKPEDISGVVTFLCSEAAGYITGQTLVVDGGVLM